MIFFLKSELIFVCFWCFLKWQLKPVLSAFMTVNREIWNKGKRHYCTTFVCPKGQLKGQFLIILVVFPFCEIILFLHAKERNGSIHNKAEILEKAVFKFLALFNRTWERKPCLVIISLIAGINPQLWLFCCKVLKSSGRVGPTTHGRTVRPALPPVIVDRADSAWSIFFQHVYIRLNAEGDANVYQLNRTETFTMESGGRPSWRPSVRPGQRWNSCQMCFPGKSRFQGGLLAIKTDSPYSWGIIVVYEGADIDSLILQTQNHIRNNNLCIFWTGW